MHEGEIAGLRLVVVALNARPRSRHDQVVSHHRFALHLERVVEAAEEDVSFDRVAAVSRRPVDENARVAGVVHDVADDPVVVRALLDLDAVALRGPLRVVDVVQRDDRVSHRHLAVVRPEVHPLTGVARISRLVDLVSRDVKPRGVSRVRGDPHPVAVVDLAAVDPHVGAVVELDQVVATGDLEVPETHVAGRPWTPTLITFCRLSGRVITGGFLGSAAVIQIGRVFVPASTSG